MAVKLSRTQGVPPQEALRKQPQPVPRHYGVRGIAGLLAPVLRPAFRKRAPAAAQLLADWESLAGPQVAAMATPVKFAGGTLTLACTGVAALELQHGAPALIGRLNLGLGRAMVERLRFVQAAATPQAPPAAAMCDIAPPPDDLPEGPLGEALARWHAGIVSRR